jgi:hypothetical protein
MEQRHREQMAELAGMQAGQIAELEERVDFAERLLAKQREHRPVGGGRPAAVRVRIPPRALWWQDSGRLVLLSR